MWNGMNHKNILSGLIAVRDLFVLLTEIVRGRRGPWSVALEWIDFWCVHNLYPEEWNCVPAVPCLNLQMQPVW